MAEPMQMPHILWEEIRQIVETRLKQGSLKKPIVFALYTEEHDHHKVITYREIPTVKQLSWHWRYGYY